jgi:single-strand DNA-binding protein
MNKVILMGRITKDLELKQSGSTQFLNFSIAVEREFAKQGEKREVDFLNCTAFGKVAEFISKYFAKGRMILIKDARIQNRTWEDGEGKKHYATDIIVNQAGFTGEKKQNEGDAHEPNSSNNSNSSSGGFYPVGDDDDPLPF